MKRTSQQWKIGLLVFALSAGISGCSDRNKWLRTGGVVEPTPQEVRASALEFGSSLENLNGGPYTYAIAGMEKVRHDCGRYFDTLALLRRDANASRDLFSIGGGTSAAVLGIVSASAKAIALTAAGFAATDLTLNSLESNMLFAPVAEDLKRMTSQAMAGFEKDSATIAVLTSLKASESSGASTLGDKIAARKLVGIYASFCAPSSIESYVKKALAQANVSITDDGVVGAARLVIPTALAELGAPPMDETNAAAVAAFLQTGYDVTDRRTAFKTSYPTIYAAAVTETGAGAELTSRGKSAAAFFESAIRADPSFARKVQAVYGAPPAGAALVTTPTAPSAVENAANLKTGTTVSGK